MIGIVDSGLGGLAVVRAINELTPGLETVYLADHAYFPYGRKPAAVIIQRLEKIVDWLVKRHCRLIVIACNTITAVTIDRLRRRYRIAFIGTEPAVKNGGAVLVTPATASSRRYRALARKYPVTSLACPGLAEAVERGLNLAEYLPRLPAGVKTVVLGCTHYLLVKQQIQRHYGAGIKLVDPSRAIARQTVKVLGRRAVQGKCRYYTTGSAATAGRRAGRLLGQRIIFSRCSL